MEWLTSPWTAVTAAIVMLGLVFLAILGYRFRVSKERGFEASRDTGKELKPIPCMPEKYASILVSAVNRAVLHQTSLEKIARDTVELQMSIYEEHGISAVALLRESFHNLLLSKKVPVDEARRETREYLHVLRQCINDDLKNYARKWFKNNHYAEKSEEGWGIYIALKKQTVTHIVRSILDREWMSDLVTLQDIIAANDECRSELEHIIEQVFNSARRISLEKTKEALREREAYSSYIKDLTGIDPYDSPEIN